MASGVPIFANGAVSATFSVVFAEATQNFKSLKQTDLTLPPGGRQPIAEMVFVDGNPQIKIHMERFLAESPEYQIGTLIHEMQHVYDALAVGAESYYELYKAYSDGHGEIFGVLLKPTYSISRLEIRARATEIKYYNSLLNGMERSSPGYSHVSSLRDMKQNEINYYTEMMH